MKPLTEERRKYYKAQQIEDGVPVRFMEDGRSVRIETGENTKKGCNIIYHFMYWSFSRATALEIAKETGTKAVFH